jgi:hypothetical protein
VAEILPREAPLQRIEFGMSARGSRYVSASSSGLARVPDRTIGSVSRPWFNSGWGWGPTQISMGRVWAAVVDSRGSPSLLGSLLPRQGLTDQNQYQIGGRTTYSSPVAMGGRCDSRWRAAGRHGGTWWCRPSLESLAHLRHREARNTSMPPCCRIARAVLTWSFFSSAINTAGAPVCGSC